MTEKFRIQVLNQISAHGLRRLPWDQFQISGDGEEPHAILVRSADLHRAVIPASVLAIGRAGPGTNNIPVAALSARGVPVFNAPGANANAVKELVLAGMLLAARNLDGALQVRRRARPGRPGARDDRSRPARRRTPATSWPGTPSASSVWARSVAWSRTRRSSSACT